MSTLAVGWVAGLDGDGYTKPPCLHEVADHRCGTRARYALDQCRCPECRLANTRYERTRLTWLSRAVPHPRVDAEPARRHIRGLIGAGMGLRVIGKVTGLSTGTLGKLLYGIPSQGRPPSRTVARRTADKILSTTLRLADGQKLTDSVARQETRAIIEELLARGWTRAAIGQRVHGPGATSLQVHPSRRGVSAGTLATLRQLLTEYPPARRHPRGGTYPPKAKREPRYVRCDTPGVALPTNVHLIPDRHRLGLALQSAQARLQDDVVRAELEAAFS